jgi:hypothetical protein
MPNATVGANARSMSGKPTKAKREGKRKGGGAADFADWAAASFDPLPPSALKTMEPPSKEVWAGYLVRYRVALIVLGKTKDELKSMAQKDGAEDVLDELKDSVSFLKAMTEAISAAKVRLLSAAAAAIRDNAAAAGA